MVALFLTGLQDDLPILILEVLSKFMKRSNKLRVNELFARSFEKDANINKYEFIIVTEKGRKIDITKDARKNIKINSSGGTPPFRKDYEGDIFSVDKFVGGKFIVKHDWLVL
ncbi:hypothetical protein RhiirA4_464460 [Rhizophagus irregularis]|uniref:Uncharacterized protein n=1 Tax=Rhizophagus irregularis TaxID=588596 RepID=A0A2I1GQ67_9GLOM|nr:hypothetical protein RhiirA4_464460 [Rhizophagus irregularis]